MTDDWKKKTRDLIHRHEAQSIKPVRDEAWRSEQAMLGAVRRILMNADRENDDQNGSRHLESTIPEPQTFSHLAEGMPALTSGLALLLLGLLVCLGADAFSDSSSRMTLWLASLVCVGYGAKSIDRANSLWPQCARPRAAIFGLSQIAVGVFAVASAKVFGGTEQTLVLWSYAVASVVIGGWHTWFGNTLPKSIRTLANRGESE